MITPSGYNTDHSGIIEIILLNNTGTVVYIDGEYILANEFFPARDSQEYHTITGVYITKQISEFSSSQKSGNVNDSPISTEFILKSMPVKQQFHKDMPYRWFQKINQPKF